jgi:hypothetical protein
MKLIGKFWLKSGSIVESEYQFPEEITEEQALIKNTELVNNLKTSYRTEDLGYIQVGKLLVRMSNIEAALVYLDTDSTNTVSQ